MIIKAIINGGIITVDGRKYIVDRDTNNKYITERYMPKRVRELSASRYGGKIYLDKDFENTKNNRRKDALLQHEIAHTRLHRTEGDGITKDHREAAIDQQSKEFKKDIDPQLGLEFIKEMHRKDRRGKDKLKTKSKYNKKDKIAVENLEKFKKYEDKKEPHSHRIEYEADAYASAHKNGDQLKRAIRDCYKQSKRDKSYKRTMLANENMTPEYFEANKDRLKKEYNIMVQNDMNIRSKALKDKSINKDAYRESIELLLDEAIELLEREN